MNLFLALSLTLVLNLGCEKSSDQKSKETKSTADQQPKESDKKQVKPFNAEFSETFFRDFSREYHSFCF